MPTGHKIKISTKELERMKCMFYIHQIAFLHTSFNVSVIEEEFSCGSMADMTGEAEYSLGGQCFTVVSRSSWKEGLVVRATRATCTNK